MISNHIGMNEFDDVRLDPVTDTPRTNPVSGSYADVASQGVYTSQMSA
jgi:hypothetical protein